MFLFQAQHYTKSRLQQTSRKRFITHITIVALAIMAAAASGIMLGWFIRDQYRDDPQFFSPFFEKVQRPISKPLQKYAFLELANKEYSPSTISIIDTIQDSATFTSYLFSYQTTGGLITGQLNIPQSLRETLSQNQEVEQSAIIMLRGYYPLASYSTGGGTRNAAAALAEAGFITIAPDFLGYGGSDPEFEDSWEARLAKPDQILHLIATVAESGIPITTSTNTSTTLQIPRTNLGIWGHSNGGQIALSVLQISSEPFPTTLWAPVTAPFPYSVLYFGLEQADEGKSQRKWLSQFEQLYDVYDFSISQHISRLIGPIQLHHGKADEAAPIAWSDTFEKWIQTENNTRISQSTEMIENETEPNTDSKKNDLNPILLTYHRYQGADHNMNPSWDNVIARDIQFFNQFLRGE